MNLLYYYGQYSRLHDAEKRELMNQLINERLNIVCEARIYRILTRLTFQSLRKKHGESFVFTPDEQCLNTLLGELGLAPSTCLKWYYATFKKKPLRLVPDACADDPVGNVCDCCITPAVRVRLQANYEYRLASKRMYQLIVKVELFKQALLKAGLVLDDDTLRKSLRRLVEHKYYLNRFKRRTRYHLREQDINVQQVLDTQQIGAMAVLKWLYVLLHHPELMRRARDGDIKPDEVFEKPMIVLRTDVMQGGAF